MRKIKEFLSSNLNKIIAIGIATLFSIIFPILFYACFFHDYQVSSKTSDWGAFSDYLSPFVSLLNIGVLIWITFEVKAYEKKKDERLKKLEKDFSLSQLRLQTYKELLSRCQEYEIMAFNILQERSECKITPLEFKISASHITEMFSNFSFLFKFNKTNTGKLIDSLKELGQLYKTIRKDDRDLNIKEYRKQLSILEDGKTNLFKDMKNEIKKDFIAKPLEDV